MLADISPRQIVNRDLLQKLCDTIRTHAGWGSAHLAAYHGLSDCFKMPQMKR